jgi:hypothetical protein
VRPHRLDEPSAPDLKPGILYSVSSVFSVAKTRAAWWSTVSENGNYCLVLAVTAR